MKRHSLLLLTLSGLVQFSQADPKKVIFLTSDDLNHASGTHEFYAGGLLLKDAFAKSNVADELVFEVINNWSGDADPLEGADAIIHYYKGNKAHLMNKYVPIINALTEKGVGQMFIHYGVDPCTEIDGALKTWTGGVYKDKFSTNPHWTIKAQLENHPINTGVKAYTKLDEWYCNIDFNRELEIGYDKADKVGCPHCVMHGKNEDFQKGKIKGGFKGREMSDRELTVSWAIEREDGGRGAGFTGAHYHANWAHDEFRKQVMNAIAWCAKVSLPAEGITSPPITQEMINANLDERKKGGLKKIFLAAEKKKAEKKVSLAR